MSNDKNKAIVRRFIEAFSANDQATLMEVVGPDFEARPPGLPAPVDREMLLQRISMLGSAFSELQVTIEDQLAEGDRVVSRFNWQGTHTGDFFGLLPTGKPVTVSIISIERIKDGKIVERWVNQDDLGLMQQLGMIPTS